MLKFRPLVVTLMILFSISWTARYSLASTYVDIEDSEIYNILSQLEAEGVISDGLLSTKPLSRKEVVRLIHEADENSVDRSEFIKSLVSALKLRIKPEEYETGGLKPLDTVYAKYIYTNAYVLTLNGTQNEKEQAFNYNNDGDLYHPGSNYRTGITSRAEDLGPFSVYLNPEFRASDYTEDTTLKKGYGVLDFSWLDIILGKDSQWWGPGYNSSILLSDNAEPFTMIKLTSPDPLHLPWIFKYLGPFQYSFFVTRLEKDRDGLPEPYLWGLRFNFKPNPIVEIGLQETEMLAGPQDVDTWLDSFAGTNKHQANPMTDGRAGYDLKLTVPFKLQPLQMYYEADAEDNVHVWPSKWAYLYGINLPRVLGLERIGLRAEYAMTHMHLWPGDTWYTHVNTGGYTYNGLVIGDHMGTDSEDFYTELSYFIPEKNVHLFLSYDAETHNETGPVSEFTNEFKLTGEIMLVKHVDITVSFGNGQIKNSGNVPGPVHELNEVSSGVQYLF